MIFNLFGRSKKSKFRFLNISAALILVATLFMGKAHADAILVTSWTPGKLGHTSVISQDKEGKWHYFYWGIKLAYQQQVPEEYVKNINTFNLWMQQQEQENKKPKNITGYYTHGFYIKGDFTKTTEYYSKQVNGHKTWKYFIVLNLCSVVSRRALNKGILADGKPFAKHLKYIAKDFIPFYDDFPNHYRKLIERSFKGTEFEGPSDWGKVTNKRILRMMGQAGSSST